MSTEAPIAKATARPFPERVLRSLSVWINSVGAGVLAAMMLLTAADVILRYFFNRPIMGSLEITEFMMALVVGFALAYTGINKEHVTVDVLITKLRPRAQAVLNTLTYALSLGIFGLMTWRSFVFADNLQLNGLISSTLSIPVYPFVYALSVGCAIFCLVLIYDVIQYAIQIVKGTKWWVWSGLFLIIIIVLVAFSTPAWYAGLRSMITPATVGITSVVLLILLLFSAMPIGATMALLGFLGLALIAGLVPAFTSLGSSPYRTVASYGLSVVPMFILMGEFCFRSRLSQDLYFAVNKWLGHLPGGLAMATIGAAAGFAAVSGSSVATVATIGMVSLPEMKKYGYNPSLASGAIAAGGGLGILIPPSVIMVIYGILTEQSIGKLFLAGFIPGIIQAIFYMITIYILCRRNPQLGPPGARAMFKERLISLKDTSGVIILFVLVIGGIYAGIFTPTEAAGVGAFGALVIALIKRALNWKGFTASLIETGKTTAMLFIILIGAAVLGYFLAITRLPFQLSTFVGGLELNRYVILLIIIIIYFILGMIMSSMAMIILTIPIIFPVIMALGFDPIWFGIIIVRLVEIAQLTPPVAINVFVMHAIAKDIPLHTIFRGVVPFLIADVFHLALLVGVPQLSLFIPNFMK